MISKRPNRILSLPLALGCLAALLLQSETLAQPGPAAADASLGDALSEAGLTFELEKVDGGWDYDVSTPEGYSFKLREFEGEFTFTLEEAAVGHPTSGQWRAEMIVDSVTCPGKEEHATRVLTALSRMDLILIPVITDGRSQDRIPYTFTAPFGAEQLLAPVWGALERVGTLVSPSYPSPGVDNVYPFGVRVQRLREGRDSALITNIKGQIIVVADDSILSLWSGRNDQCQGSGLVTWSLLD